MPPRPFPLPLSIGTDIAAIERTRTILKKDNSHPQHLIRLARRVLTRRERLQFWRRYGKWDLSVPGYMEGVCKFLAGRFAAKEATIKAVLWRKLSFHDIIIRTPVHGEEMSAVILDNQSTDDRPIKHESELLAQARMARSNAPKWAWSSTQGVKEDDARGVTRTVLSGETDKSTVAGSQANASPKISPDNAHALQLDEGEDEEDLVGQIAKISISHDGDYATAVCMAVQETSQGDVSGNFGARTQHWSGKYDRERPG